MCDNRLFHDFPRLAKESGFYFNYRPKLIDWSQIDNIDLEDIAKHKRFELLEEKLEFVSHCELDDGITKVLDCNFVKLFRLAQLSVSYLRHCQFYLDRGVVLLQEQLTAALKEAESIRNTVSIQNSVKCLECDKTFMTLSYLESHQRRRHSTSNPKCVSIAVQTDREVKKVKISQNTEQQTEIIKTVSSESQTNQVKSFDVGLMTDLETPSTEPIDIMQRFEGLYQRIELIEKETSFQKQQNSSDLASLFQSLLPTLQQQTLRPKKGYVNISADDTKEKEKQEHSVNVENEPELLVKIQNKPEINVTSDEEEVKKARSVSFNNETPSQSIAEQSLVQVNSENNIDSGSTVASKRIRKKVNMLMEDTPVPIPRPRPRKSTITRQTSLLIDFEDTDSDEQKHNTPVLKYENNLEEKSPINNPVLNKEKLVEMVPYIELPTPVISILDQPKIEEKTFEKMTVNIQNDTDTIIRDKELKPKPKSIFKTFVKKSSPKFKGLRKSIRKSWSNFSDSKLFNNDGMLIRPTILNKNDDVDEDSSSDEMVVSEKDSKQKNKFDKKLRELGIDPEWSGIPENSYTRVQAILDQRTQLIEKKNPEYIRRRHHLEALIAQRNKKANKDNDPVIDNQQIALPEQTKMYDIESDTDTESHQSPIKDRARNSSSLNSIPSLIPDEKSSNFQNSSKTFHNKNSTEVEIQTGIAGSDSSDISEIEKEHKPPVTLKSSIFSKGKDEVKKKVVFADNFEIETSHDLMKTPNSSNSFTSSSDWDIPMP